MCNLVRLAIILGIFSAASIALGADFEAHPSLAVSEEYADNVFETPGNRVSDYITRILPGIVMSYKAPSLTGDLSYVFDYRNYARNTHKNEVAHSLSTKGHLNVVENLMYLDVSDEYQRVPLDATRDTSSGSLFVNQSDRNQATVSPNLIFHPTERIMVKAAYRFIDIRYFDPGGIDKVDHVASLDMAYELTKRLSLTAGYTFTRELADIDNFSQHQVLGGFRYEYADKSFVYAQAGKNRLQYDRGTLLDSFVWNAGITQVFDTVTGTISTGVKYNDDPRSTVIKEVFVSGTAEKRFINGSLSLFPYYSEFVQSKSNILQTRKYGAIVRSQYELTDDINCTVSFTAEKYEQPQLGSYTRRFQIIPRLNYILAKELTASLSYNYDDYYSPGILVDNRHVNRAMIEIKKIF